MATYEDFQIDQGTDVNIQLQLATPEGAAKDLVGYSVNAQMRRTYNTSDSDAIAFLTQVQNPATAGIINLQLTNTQTDALKAGRYVYDVELSFLDSDQNTIVERILEGQINVTPSVTR